ncbi:Fluconazole resistance protein 1 [Zalaria obscura]|uniref:Fluconazole resistance protein 1 n=1 Tax=Zalaria obscura TaxID=2024903 RepID=A0ACC3SHT4_9PEZI
MPYPKGYVEVLEEQHAQLAQGLLLSCRLLIAAHAWPGGSLPERNGQPLIHEIITTLGVLEQHGDHSGVAVDGSRPEEDGAQQTSFLESGSFGTHSGQSDVTPEFRDGIQAYQSSICGELWTVDDHDQVFLAEVGGSMDEVGPQCIPTNVSVSSLLRTASRYHGSRLTKKHGFPTGIRPSLNTILFNYDRTDGSQPAISASGSMVMPCFTEFML